jgi:ankyrin repeat protein
MDTSLFGSLLGSQASCVEKDAEIEAKINNGKTPLSCAAQSGSVDVVRYLIDKGAEITTKDNDGNNPLILAARNGHEAVVQILLDKGADIHSKDNYGRGLLSFTAKSRDEAVVRLLVEKGADIEAKDNSGRTPLSYAAEWGKVANVKLLLDKGAEVIVDPTPARRHSCWPRNRSGKITCNFYSNEEPTPKLKTTLDVRPGTVPEYWGDILSKIRDDENHPLHILYQQPATAASGHRPTSGKTPGNGGIRISDICN